MRATRGFRDQLRIAYQNRPRIFDRNIKLPELLYRKVVEVDERMSAQGDVVAPLDEEGVKRDLAAARKEGFKSIAIAFLQWPLVPIMLVLAPISIVLTKRMGA